MGETPQISVIVVAGGNGGIGTAVCELLRQAGAQVVAIGRDAEEDGGSGTYCTVRADLRYWEEWERATRIIRGRFGRIDALVHCAGVLIPGTVTSLSPEEVENIVTANLHSVVYGTRSVLPMMLRQRKGSIVTVGSIGGILPMPFESMYSAAKFAVRGFCLSLAEELRGTGVHMSLLSVGSVKTPMLDTEAADDSSITAFLTKPLEPIQVARAVLNVLRHPRLETMIPRVSGYAASVLSHFPRLYGVLHRLLLRLGQKNKRAYILQRKKEFTVDLRYEVPS